MKRAVHAVAWLLLAVSAFVLWPERWGGSMTYVITSGTSMQPGFVAGDLAVLRAASDYRVGDVAAYDSSELKKIVMHRITKETDEGYTFQGDNNDFLDPETVTDEQMLGKLVLRVPGVAKYLEWLLKPVNLALAVGALLLLLLDRRQSEQAPPPAIVAADLDLEPVAINGLHVPATAVVADLADEGDLERLARRYQRPVLRDAETGDGFVIDGATVYRHRVPVEAAPEVGSGRDWAYGIDPEVVALLPRPRRTDAHIDYGVDIPKLLKLG